MSCEPPVMKRSDNPGQPLTRTFSRITARIVMIKKVARLVRPVKNDDAKSRSSARNGRRGFGFHRLPSSLCFSRLMTSSATMFEQNVMTNSSAPSMNRIR